MIEARDIHHAWLAAMIEQRRLVAEERQSWETLPEREKKLDEMIAAELMRKVNAAHVWYHGESSSFYLGSEWDNPDLLSVDLGTIEEALGNRELNKTMLQMLAEALVDMAEAQAAYRHEREQVYQEKRLYEALRQQCALTDGLRRNEAERASSLFENLQRTAEELDALKEEHEALLKKHRTLPEKEEGK
jgi:hypothetical protein